MDDRSNGDNKGIFSKPLFIFKEMIVVYEENIKFSVWCLVSFDGICFQGKNNNASTVNITLNP